MALRLGTVESARMAAGRSEASWGCQERLVPNVPIATDGAGLSREPERRMSASAGSGRHTLIGGGPDSCQLPVGMDH